MSQTQIVTVAGPKLGFSTNHNQTLVRRPSAADRGEKRGLTTNHNQTVIRG